MTGMDRFQAAARELGPERSAQALRAFSEPSSSATWHDCACARAYGAPGELFGEMGKLMEKDTSLGGFDAASRVLGISRKSVVTISESHCCAVMPYFELVSEGDPKKMIAALRAEAAKADPTQWHGGRVRRALAEAGKIVSVVIAALAFWR